jgi:hypothetical protein
MEDKGNNANVAHVCNNKAFKAALLSVANASWQRERWGNRMMDHGEDPAGNGEANEGEKEKRGEVGDSMGGRSMAMTMSTLLLLPLLLLKLRQSYHDQIARITLGSKIISNLWLILAQNICMF